MNINHDELERLAREICDSRNGSGHYDKSGTHRNHWRNLARSEIEHARGIGMLADLMAAFNTMWGVK